MPSNYLTPSALNNPIGFPHLPTTVSPESSDVLHSSLSSINSHLNLSIEAICSQSTFDVVGLNEDLMNIIQYLQRVLSIQRYTEQEIALLGEIGWQTNILSSLIDERVNLQNMDVSVNNLHEVIMVKQDQNSLMLLKNREEELHATNSNTRRLSKQLLSILELWYIANAEHPYLDDRSTVYLVRESGLSETQVRNWYVTYFFFKCVTNINNFRISNKRRKERAVHVSEELVKLLC